jgi:hypothetical protein
MRLWDALERGLLCPLQSGVAKEQQRRHGHHTFNRAEVSLGGLRRSFAGSPWCKSYIRSSPQAGYEALGNVLRIFPIAWQFRREHAIF